MATEEHAERPAPRQTSQPADASREPDVTLVSLDMIEEARTRLAPILRRVPVEPADALSRLAGRVILVKPEYRQRTGSYKIRGAYNRICRLPPGSEVVAASAGNHAQGVALAASLTGMRATIFMPRSAPYPKVDATRTYGAEVRLEGDVVDDSIAAAREHAAAAGATWIHPFDDPEIIAGQGTLGIEVAEEAPEDLETVVVPVGGGGLAAGVAAALAALRPRVRVIGVQAEGAASVVASLRAGRPVPVEAPATMADGIAVRSPSPLTFAHLRRLVDDVVTVSEEDISRALLVLLERSKAVVEPAGAVGVAALLVGKIPGTGPALTILSGGNIDPLLLIRVIEHGLSATGRYLLLRITLDDRPGALAALTGEVARMGLNVLEVAHHRVGLDLGIDKVAVLLTVETRDPEHRSEVLAALRKAGFEVELLERVP